MQNRQIKMLAVVTDNAVGFFKIGHSLFNSFSQNWYSCRLHNYIETQEIFEFLKIVVHVRKSVLCFYVKDYLV